MRQSLPTIKMTQSFVGDNVGVVTVGKIDGRLEGEMEGFVAEGCFEGVMEGVRVGEKV